MPDSAPDASVSIPSAPGPLPRAAALLDDGHLDADALLADVAAALQQRGHRVHGLLMTRPSVGAGCAVPMVLVDIVRGDQYLVSQDLGPGATGCRADTQGFARASGVLRAATGPDVDVVIANRFGGLEAEGGGFCAELLGLMAADVPLLTLVKTRHAQAWSTFTGGATVLPAERAAAIDWVERTLAQPAQAPAA